MTKQAQTTKTPQTPAMTAQDTALERLKDRLSQEPLLQVLTRLSAK